MRILCLWKFPGNCHGVSLSIQMDSSIHVMDVGVMMYVFFCNWIPRLRLAEYCMMIDFLFRTDLDFKEDYMLSEIYIYIILDVVKYSQVYSIVIHTESQQSQLTLIWESGAHPKTDYPWLSCEGQVWLSIPDSESIFILYRVRAGTLHESLTGSEPCDSAWDSAKTFYVDFMLLLVFVPICLLVLSQPNCITWMVDH